MQSLGELGKLELSTRDLLQYEIEGNCDQDREASSFLKVKIAEVQDSVHVRKQEEGQRRKSAYLSKCTGDWMGGT